MHKLSERLKELKMEKGISLPALAKELKIGKSSLYRWENGEADINGTQLIKLAIYFKVSTDYLLGLED